MVVTGCLSLLGGILAAFLVSIDTGSIFIFASILLNTVGITLLQLGKRK